MQQAQSLQWRDVLGSEVNFGIAPEMLDACRSVSFRIGGPQLGSIGVTSALRGEGRTTVAQALALVQAYDYRRQVTLVEADLEGASFARRLHVAARPGLAELAQGISSLSDVLQPAAPRLALISAGIPLPDAAGGIIELLRAGVLATIQRECEVVIIDLPPLVASPYGRRAVQMCEQLVMVIRAGITPLNRVREATESLSPSPAILLNGVDSSLPRWMKALLSV